MVGGGFLDLGLLVASGFLFEDGFGYDLFIRLRSSLVIRPSGGGVWVEGLATLEILGEFEAEIVPNRPLRFNEVGLAEEGLAQWRFYLKKSEMVSKDRKTKNCQNYRNIY